jgi:hypothetical protein
MKDQLPSKGWRSATALLKVGLSFALFPLANCWAVISAQIDHTEWNWQRLSLRKAGHSNTVSLADLTHWRSPRGLDYKIAGNKLTLTPRDKSGELSIALDSGRVTRAKGCLANLNRRSLTRVTGTVRERSFFTLDRADFRIDVKDLQSYFGGFVRPIGNGHLEIASGPRGVGASRRYLGKRILESSTFDLNIVGLTKQGLKVSVMGSLTRIRYEGKVVSVVSYTAGFRNEERKPMVLQPGRFAVHSDSEASAVSYVREYTSFGPWPGKIGYDGSFMGPGAGNGASRILKPGQGGAFLFSQVALDDLSQMPKAITFDYSDGIRQFTISVPVGARRSDSGDGE